jgi:Domain of unknown function (DUF4338)
VFTKGVIADPDLMRQAVITSLSRQGFKVVDGTISPPPQNSKVHLRELHVEAVLHQRERSRGGLQTHEKSLISRIADGTEVVPEKIKPHIVLVEPRSENERLFRWARLHWSIPTSAGYGRRLRFLVFDEANGRLMGLLGLSDPVYALGSRDAWIGWDAEAKRERLRRVMDAFVLGAVAPYNQLLAGKLMALLVTSAEVQQAYGDRYSGTTGRISGSANHSPLALVTTTSALGRSSIYNRLRLDSRSVAHSVGYTTGSGDFQFANGLYDSLVAYARIHCSATAKHEKWGTGFRNRREVVKKTLTHLGLGEALLYHGVRREVFVFPMGTNARDALVYGSDLEPFGESADELSDYWKARWLIPRAERTPQFREFSRDSWRLWDEASPAT